MTRENEYSGGDMGRCFEAAYITEYLKWPNLLYMLVYIQETAVLVDFFLIYWNDSYNYKWNLAN